MTNQYNVPKERFDQIFSEIHGSIKNYPTEELLAVGTCLHALSVGVLIQALGMKGTAEFLYREADNLVGGK